MTEKNGRKILVIEDEPFICRVCVRTLSAEGFEVDVAGNGLVALEMTGKKKYDLIFSDIRTPEMNGIEFFRRVKQQDPVLANHIIFTSGDVMSPDVKEFMSTNHNPFLPKPFMPEELRAIVRKTMGNTPPATVT